MSEKYPNWIFLDTFFNFLNIKNFGHKSLGKYFNIVEGCEGDLVVKVETYEHVAIAIYGMIHQNS